KAASSPGGDRSGASHAAWLAPATPGLTAPNHSTAPRHPTAPSHLTTLAPLLTQAKLPHRHIRHAKPHTTHAVVQPAIAPKSARKSSTNALAGDSVTSC